MGSTEQSETNKKRLSVTISERFFRPNDTQDPCYYLESVIPEGHEDNRVLLFGIHTYSPDDSNTELTLLKSLSDFFGEISIAKYAGIRIPGLEGSVLNMFRYMKSLEGPGKFSKILTGEFTFQKNEPSPLQPEHNINDTQAKTVEVATPSFFEPVTVGVNLYGPYGKPTTSIVMAFCYGKKDFQRVPDRFVAAQSLFSLQPWSIFNRLSPDINRVKEGLK